MWVAGVDVSQRRGQTVALLARDTRALEVLTVPDAEAVVGLVCARGAMVVAVDSPLRPSRLLLRDPAYRRRYGLVERAGWRGPLYANYRVSDYELIRRGMPLYQVPACEAQAAGWMRVGFTLARRLQACGYRVPMHRADFAATLIEVFPDAAFVTLLGGRPARKTGRDGRHGRAARWTVLAQYGVRLPEASSHDALDAAAAALTALRWQDGDACAVGEPEEGLIVLPVPASSLRDRYHRLPDIRERP
jgi:predicted nuclease with RNAse H fold